MNLHRATKPDWEGVNELSLLQKVARSTGGWLTVGNVVTVVGLGLSLSGVEDLKKGRYKRGVIKLVGGRICDLADGKLADLTLTKSPKGEFLDSAADKIVIARATAVMANRGALAENQAANMLVTSGVNVGLAALGVGLGRRIHPSEAGKHYVALQSGAVFTAGALLVARESGSCLKKPLEMLRDTAVTVSEHIWTEAVSGYFQDLSQRASETVPEGPS